MGNRLNKFFGARDMTVGSPWRVLVSFALPLLIGNIAQQLYSTVDSIIVGRYIGDGALAAVGASMPVLNMFIVLFMGISTGASIMVSQYFGAKDRENLSHTVGTAMALLFMGGLVLMIIGPLIAEPVMRALGTPEEIFLDCVNYLKIFLFGIMGCAFYNILSGLLRGLGDSVMPLMFLLLACGLNIVLDIVFVANFGWGVPGVAIATVLSQAISAVLCLIRILKMRDVIDVSARIFKPVGAVVLKIVKLGLPSGVSMAIFSVASLAMQLLINTFGTNVITACVMTMRVDGFAMIPNFTFGMAMSVYTGQNIGAGKLDRVREGVKENFRLSVTVCVVMVMLVLIFGRSLLNLFTETPAVIDLSMRILYILSIGYVAMAISQIFVGVQNGAGDTMTPMWLNIIITVGIRVPLAYGLTYMTRSAINPGGMPEMMYVALLLSWVGFAAAAYIFYRRGKWMKKGLTKQSQKAAEELL